MASQHKRLKRRMSRRVAYYRLHEFRKLVIIFGFDTARRMYKGRFWRPDPNITFRVMSWDVENQRWRE